MKSQFRKLLLDTVIDMETIVFKVIYPQFEIFSILQSRLASLHKCSVLNIPDIVSILRLWHLAAMIWHIQTDIAFLFKIADK